MQAIPLIFVNLYVMLGLLVSFFGPLQYYNYNKGPVFIFIMSFLLIINIGYFFGSKSPIHYTKKISPARQQAIVKKIFVVCLTFSTLFMTYEFLYALLVKNFTFSLSDAGASYIKQYAGHERNSGGYDLNFLLVSFGSLFVFITQVWGLLFFRKLSKKTKIATLYVFSLTLLVYSVGGGKQKQLGDVLVYLGVVTLLVQAHLGRLKASTFVKIAVVGSLGLSLMLAILSYRYQSIGVDLQVLNYNLHPLVYLERGGLIEQTLGPDVAFPIIMLSGYLGQGYFGLSLAMEQPLTWTYFGGSSYSFSVILNKVFGTEFLVEESYPYLVGSATGWAETKWHTVFAWLASDLTFPGTILFFGFVAFQFARAWKEALYYRNPFSTLLVALLAVGAFYIPANNQLMHSPGGLWTLACVLLLYASLAPKFQGFAFASAQRKPAQLRMPKYRKSYS